MPARGGRSSPRRSSTRLHNFWPKRGPQAWCCISGRILDQADGWYVPLTLILGLDNQHPLCREEIFGSLASVIHFGAEDDVITIANDSDYGLVGGVWTQSLSRALREAARIRSLSTNTSQAVSNPRSAGSSKAASGAKRAVQPYTTMVRSRP